MRFGHPNAAHTRNPNLGKDHLHHVEAHKSAYDPKPASRAGTSDYVHADRSYAE